MTTTATTALALLLSCVALDARAQHAGHAGATPPPQAAAATADEGHPTSKHHGHAMPATPAPARADAHAGHAMSMHDGHAMPASQAPAGADAHAGHATSTSPPATDAHDASAHGMHAMPGHTGHAMHGMHDDMPAQTTADAAPHTPVPVPTDADRAAAFPALGGHAAHDRGHFGFLRVDRLERDDDGGTGWEAIGWYGGDTRRAWLRTEGHAAGGRVEDASVELLYGRLVAPWWDVVAGLRQDVGDGPARSWAAFGVQGVAPYKFEVRATGYVGAAGRTAARLEGEYDTLLTNRAVLQWRAEADLYGRDDPARGLGRGLSSVEAGLRLRYEITRRFAPYVGVEHERAYGRTATLRARDGHAARDTRAVAGLRLAF